MTAVAEPDDGQIIVNGPPDMDRDDAVLAECVPPAYGSDEDPHGGRLDDAQHHDGDE